MSRVKLDEGDRGESLACEYLKTKGFDIIDRNFRLKGGEIDIIAIDPSTHSTGSGQARSGPNGILVFIEVKTRTSYQFGTGFEAITPWKLKALIKSAHFYKVTHRGLPDAMRIDAISVVLDAEGRIEQFEHMENITQ